MSDAALAAHVLPLLHSVPDPVAGDGDALAEHALLTADPAGVEATLYHLTRLARNRAAGAVTPAEAPSSEELRSWLAGTGDAALAARVESGVGRSVLLAEMLEGWLEDAPAEAGLRQPLRLVAAGPSEPATSPWPAWYGGDGEGAGWQIVLNVDEDGRLIVFIEAAPEAAPEAGAVGAPGEVRLGPDATATMPLTAGSAVALGDAESLLGAPPEFNPWPALTVHTGGGATITLRRGPSPS